MDIEKPTEKTLYIRVKGIGESLEPGYLSLFIAEGSDLSKRIKIHEKLNDFLEYNVDDIDNPTLKDIIEIIGKEIDKKYLKNEMVVNCMGSRKDNVVDECKMKKLGDAWISHDPPEGTETENGVYQHISHGLCAYHAYYNTVKAKKAKD